MPRPRKYEDAATKQLAYRIRKERERLALDAAMRGLAQAVRQARSHGAVLVALDGIATDDWTRMLGELAQAISEGSKAAMANTASSSMADAT